jgi:hypothetical protein
MGAKRGIFESRTKKLQTFGKKMLREIFGPQEGQYEHLHDIRGLYGLPNDMQDRLGWERQGMHTEYLWGNFFEGYHLDDQGMTGQY